MKKKNRDKSISTIILLLSGLAIILWFFNYYLSFNSISDAELAISKLNEWFLNGSKLFSLSRKDNKVFYRPYSFKPIRPDSKIHNLNQSNFFHFFDFFKFITRRTGRHIQSFNFITNVNDLYYPGINNANLGSRVFNE